MLRGSQIIDLWGPSYRLRMAMAIWLVIIPIKSSISAESRRTDLNEATKQMIGEIYKNSFMGFQELQRGNFIIESPFIAKWRQNIYYIVDAELLSGEQFDKIIPIVHKYFTDISNKIHIRTILSEDDHRSNFIIKFVPHNEWRTMPPEKIGQYVKNDPKLATYLIDPPLLSHAFRGSNRSYYILVSVSDLREIKRVTLLLRAPSAAQWNLRSEEFITSTKQHLEVATFPAFAFSNFVASDVKVRNELLSAFYNWNDSPFPAAQTR